jgi:hypothetical protein
MSTINSKEIIHEMLRNDGTYPGDPQMEAIYTYTNSFGGKTYKLIYGSPEMARANLMDMYSSPYVFNPILLWQKELGLTAEGIKELEGTL